jgi:hypothetical protein
MPAQLVADLPQARNPIPMRDPAIGFVVLSSGLKIRRQAMFRWYHTNPGIKDHVGAFLVRVGIGRNNYKIAPGLYGVGNPGNDSPVLVTANYKLTFDTLRKELRGIDAWLLVLDTRGINVWCAAGKKTFSTEELVSRVRITELEKIVRHRELIVPQLGATGVAGYRVKKACGFKVIWGPIKARDIRSFLGK